MPAVIHLSSSQIQLLESLKALLTRIGVVCEPMGPTSVAVHAFPSFLFDRHVDPVEFMTELFDRAAEGELKLTGHEEGDDATHEAALHEVLDMMACKAAVKAGDALTGEELEALLHRREEIERAGSCPHGRPTTIRLTLHDLEKQFKRT